jgi:hypothetical protein
MGEMPQGRDLKNRQKGINFYFQMTEFTDSAFLEVLLIVFPPVEKIWPQVQTNQVQ